MTVASAARCRRPSRTSTTSRASVAADTLPRSGLDSLTAAVYPLPCYRAAVRRAVLAALFTLTACQPEAEGLCEGNAGASIEVEAFYRFEDVALTDGDVLPIFIPPQGGIATELDVDMRGVGFETLASLEIEVVMRASGAVVADVGYVGDGLPLECVQDGELRVRAVPVPFVDGSVLGTLSGAEVNVTTRIVRSDDAVSEVARVVTLDAQDY